MTLEQLLTSKGYTAQELEDLRPMLSNAKFRSTLEGELTGMETTVVKVQKDLDEYDNWFTNEITPEHQRLMKEHQDAVADAAANKARFEALQKSGMRRQAGDAADPAVEEAARVAAEAARNPKGNDPKYVTSDVFQQAHERVGDAIAQATNIVSQHMQLFPNTLLDMEQLRAEAKQAKKPVKEYWEGKYKVPERKAEIAAKTVADREEVLRKEGYQKAVTELGTSNPNLTIAQPSNNPFVIRKKAAESKQPWEKTPSEVQRERLEKVVVNAAKRGELVGQ